MSKRFRNLVDVGVFLLVLSDLYRCQDLQAHEGLYIGKINTYAHQVSGNVYAVDEYTIRLKNFFYDGLGQDTFFWAGSSVRPSNVGFIVPNEHGRTNVLEPYTDRDILLRLPDKRKITTIKWLAVWNLRDNENYGDIYLPDGFEPPAPRKLSELTRQGAGVKSGTIVLMDTKTIRVPDFYFNGENNETYFWVGQGAQPSSAGFKIPNEKGYLEHLGVYMDQSFDLVLPGKLTVFEIDWFSIFNAKTAENYGSVNIPHGQDIPPTQLQTIEHKSRLPNCEQLHANLQLRWEIQGSVLSLELTGAIGDDEYMAFGISGSQEMSTMENADVAVCFVAGPYGQVVDFNITGRHPCVPVLGTYKGACPDSRVGGKDSYQILTFSKVDGITSIIYRRDILNIDDAGDKIYSIDQPTSVVWAIGKLSRRKEPLFHHIFPRGHVRIDFGRKRAENNCHDFIRGWPPIPQKPWGPFKIVGSTVSTFVARIGPAGNYKGYRGITGQPSPSDVWYINGLMTPVLYLKRGQTYTFKVEGGSNAHNTRYFHPLYITDSPYGGFATFTESEKKDAKIYAGITFDRRGRPQPTAVGRLCVWLYNATEPRSADDFPTFPKFRNSLRLECDEGQSATLTFTPNASAPDTLYYQSYTTPNMGWKIQLVEEFSIGGGRK